MSADITVLAANHVQGTLEIKASEFGPVRLFRVGCSCGTFRGCWYSQPQLAFASHARHADRQGVSFR